MFLLIVVKSDFSGGSEHFRWFPRVVAYGISGPFDQVFIFLGLSFSRFALLSMGNDGFDFIMFFIDKFWWRFREIRSVGVVFGVWHQ